MMASNINTTSRDGGLQATAQVNNIDDLYEVIYNNPEFLDDSKPLVETPLHIFASAGEIHLATEIMRLKPSLAWKLNRQGQSPIHLAMQQEKYEMVLRFAEINKKLVRVKAKGGLTPLHLASQIGKIDLLVNFLEACHESIEDVTVRGETALHIVVMHDQCEALEVMVGWLKRSCKGGARQLEKAILNWKDQRGDTVLHILARKNDPRFLAVRKRMIRFLIKSGMDLNAKNLENQTALDIARATINAQLISKILMEAGAKCSGKVDNTSLSLATELRSQMTVYEKISIILSRRRSNITEDQRNALLIVVTLIATATYQSVLSPPGGVYQANAGDNNSTATIAQGKVTGGTSIMSDSHFIYFFGFNTVSLLHSIVSLVFLIPLVDVVSYAIFNPLVWLVVSYINSLVVISPLEVLRLAELIFVSFLLPLMTYLTLFAAKENNFLDLHLKKREIQIRTNAGENVW